MLCGDTSCLTGREKISNAVSVSFSSPYMCSTCTHHTQVPPPSNLLIGVQKQYFKDYLYRTATQRQAKSQDSRSGH